MLKLGRYGEIMFGEDFINRRNINIEDFFVANLSSPTSFDDQLKLEDLLQHYVDLRDFIYKYFSEHLDRLKILTSSQSNTKGYTDIKIFKKLTIEDGYIHMTPCIDFIAQENKQPPMYYSGLGIYLDENIVVIEEFEKEMIPKDHNLKATLTLYEISEAIFEDLVYVLTEGFLN